MTLYTNTGTFTGLSTTGSQTITMSGISWTPVAVIIWMTPSVNSGHSWSSDFAFGYGVKPPGSSIQSAYIATEGQYNVATSNEYLASETGVCGVIDASGTVFQNATLTGVGAGTFTINWTSNAIAAAYYYHYMAIGGTDVTNAAVVQWQTATSAGNQSITSVGFQPSLVLHIGAEDSTVAPHVTSGRVMQVGAMDANGNQWANYTFSKNGVTTAATTNNGMIQLAGQVGTGTVGACLVGMNQTTSVTSEATFVSMDSTGFTVNWTTPDATSRYVYSLCLAGCEAVVGNWNKGNNTTQDTVPTVTVPPNGITPVGVLVMNNSQVASTNEVPGLRFMVGAGDGTNNVLVGFSEKNNVATTVTTHCQEVAYSVNVFNSDTIVSPTYDAIGTLTSFAMGSFGAHWALKNAATTQICFVAFGEAYTLEPNTPITLGDPADINYTVYTSNMLPLWLDNATISWVVTQGGATICSHSTDDGQVVTYGNNLVILLGANEITQSGAVSVKVQVRKQFLNLLWRD